MLPGLGDEDEELANVIPLRRLLTGSAILLMVGASGFLLWNLSAGATRGAALLFLLVLVLGGVTAALFALPDLPVPRLRALERVVFGSLAAYLAWGAWDGLSGALAAGDVEALTWQWNLTLVQFVLLMVGYGAAVPNSWQRAVRVIGGFAATPVVVVAGLWMTDPGRAERLGSLVTMGRRIESVLVLAIAAAIGILAAYVIDQYLDLAGTTRISIRYVLQRRIGQGGMGEVWLAEHNLLARPAAVKLVRRETVQRKGSEKAEVLLRRFEREARATARLRSVNTVEVYDSGVTDDGTFYYAMELLDGLGLNELVEEHGAVPAERVVYLLEQACRSLAEAHEEGMTHRDIKPGNLFTCRLGTDVDFVKVLDFGLVEVGGLSATAAEETTDLTLDGELNGTPGYMAPELIHDSGVEPDHRADIYALGCVAYYLLTGSLVFEGPPLSVLVDHVKTEPPPPSDKTELEIPEELEAVVLKCLEKDPDDRFQSARELMQALRSARTESRWDEGRASEWWDLHRPAADRVS